MDSGKNLLRKPHRQFELIVALKNIRVVFPAAKCFPIDETLLPCKMAVDRYGIIAAMDHSIDERFAQAFGNVAATDGGIESAGITVKIFEAFCHADEYVKVVGIE